jgi:hypothetical protein
MDRIVSALLANLDEVANEGSSPVAPAKVPANRHLFSPLDRRLLAHPAQIPHAKTAAKPRREPVVAANPRKKDDRPT